MKEELLGSQRDGMKLGIKFGAKTLRDTADECAKDAAISPDYIRGLRDAAVFIESFAEVAAAEAIRG
jgi:hypothetical protein